MSQILAPETDAQLRVDFQMGQRDVEEYFLRAERQTRWRHMGSYALWAAFLLFVGIVGVIQGTPRARPTIGILLAAGAALLWFGLRYHFSAGRRVRKSAQQAIETNPGLTLPMTIEITPDGVASATDLSQSFRSWALFQSTSVESGYLYLTLRDGSALFIPQRAFADDAELARFATTAEQWRRERSGKESCAG